MISAYEMEKMAIAATDAFSDNSYDAVAADAWLNRQREKMEKQNRRVEAWQNAKVIVMAWIHHFKTQNVAST